MSPEELQTTGVSPEMASLQLEDLIRHNERRAARAHLNGAGMGEDLPSPSSQIPDYVLRRSEVIVDLSQRVNNSVNMVIADPRERRGGMGY